MLCLLPLYHLISRFTVQSRFLHTHGNLMNPKEKHYNLRRWSKSNQIRSPVALHQVSHLVRVLKSHLAAGDTLHGLCLRILSFSPTLDEIAALAGYDYVIRDLEHDQGDVQEALTSHRSLDATQPWTSGTHDPQR